MKIKQIKGEEFRRMQLLELEMLKEFDRVCRENDIRYTIFGGTLLGAVRHKGYIPWDDDADIAMLREDFERFRQCAHLLDEKICYFQDHKNDPQYRWGYAKLRKTGTTFVRVGQEHLKCKTGLFIDIFPMDDVPKSIIGQIFNDFYCFCLRKILWSEVGRVTEKNKIQKTIYKLLSKINPSFVYKRLEIMAQKSKNDSENRVRCLLFKATGKLYKKNTLKTRYAMPKKWFLDLCEYDFEDIKVFGTKDFDENLKYIYGDYMKLPDEKGREPHSPVSDYSF